MQTIKRTTFAVTGIAAAAMLSLTACAGSTPASSPSTPASTPQASSMAPAPAASSAAAMDPAADLAGPGCAAYAEQVPSGAGSVSGMALDPVATAASNNPILKTLTAAVSGQLNPKVNLVDTLNGGQFTVFAPVDEAFAKIDPATIETLKTGRRPAQQDPDLPRCTRPGHTGQDRRHAHDGPGRLRHGHRHQGRPAGRRRQRRLRRRQDRQRHGLPDRRRPDAQVSSTRHSCSGPSLVPRACQEKQRPAPTGAGLRLRHG